MALQDAIVGATHTGQHITWYAADNVTPHDLTGATLSGKIKNVATGAVVGIAGALTVVDAPTGVFTWAYATADVATEGAYTVQFTATYSGALLDRTFAESWTCKAAL